MPAMQDSIVVLMYVLYLCGRVEGGNTCSAVIYVPPYIGIYSSRLWVILLQGKFEFLGLLI